MWARGGVSQPVSDTARTRSSVGRRSVSVAWARAPSVMAALLEVSGIGGVIRISSPADFDMALDWSAGGSVECKHLTWILSLFEPNAEEPRFARCREVLASLPGCGF